MKCNFCKGETEQKLIRYVQDFQGRVVIIDNVPSEVCTQCGEQFIRPPVAEKLQKIVWGDVPRPKKVQVDSYDFAEVA
jgi:YgiT-type zinc finger domain-containing protein